MATGEHRGSVRPYQRRNMWRAIWANPREPMIVIVIVVAATSGSVELLTRPGALWTTAGIGLALLGFLLFVSYAAEFTPWIAAGAASESPRSRRIADFLRVFWRVVAAAVVLAVLAWGLTVLLRR